MRTKKVVVLSLLDVVVEVLNNRDIYDDFDAGIDTVITKEVIRNNVDSYLLKLDDPALIKEKLKDNHNNTEDSAISLMATMMMLPLIGKYKREGKLIAGEEA